MFMFYNSQDINISVNGARRENVRFRLDRIDIISENEDENGIFGFQIELSNGTTIWFERINRDRSLKIIKMYYEEINLALRNLEEQN